MAAAQVSDYTKSPLQTGDGRGPVPAESPGHPVTTTDGGGGNTYLWLHEVTNFGSFIARFRKSFYDLGDNHFAKALLFPSAALISFLLPSEKPPSPFFPK